jgi:hypothetical protein
MGLPCENCSEHARTLIERNFDKMDEICSGKGKLFEFFVKFHNYVRARYGNPAMTVEDAYVIYAPE